MADLRIVSTDQRPLSNPTTHAHIVAVGVGDHPDTATTWTLAQVIYAIRNRTHNFWVWGPRTGKWAGVRVARCGHCPAEHIRSNPDATTDNNLDSLPRRRLV